MNDRWRRRRHRARERFGVGAWVRSHYSAPWRGVVEALSDDGRHALVRPRVARSGLPCTNAKARWLSVGWLTPIEAP